MQPVGSLWGEAKTFQVAQHILQAAETKNPRLGGYLRINKLNVAGSLWSSWKQLWVMVSS